MSGFHRRGFVVRQGEQPIEADAVSKKLKAKFPPQFEAQEHRGRRFPETLGEWGKEMRAKIKHAVDEQNFETGFQLCKEFDEKEGIDWPTSINGAHCLYMLGDEDQALAMWQWIAADMEEHRTPESLDESYVPLETPFTDEQWRSMYSIAKNNSGETQWEKKNFPAAIADLGAAVEAAVSPTTKLPRLLKLAQARSDGGDPEGADEAVTQAIALARETGPEWRTLLQKETDALGITFSAVEALVSKKLSA